MGIARSGLLGLHRWLSLSAMLFWVLQAASGVLIVFHWELEDALIRAPHRPTDPAAIEARLRELAPPGSGLVIESVWTSGGASDRYDVYVETPDGEAERTIRIDGAGNVLRTLTPAESGMFDTIVGFHHDLLAGETGSWIVGLSGLLLAGNIGIALFLAWPGRQRLRALKPPPKTARGIPGVYGWHRAIGFWGALPAFALSLAGVLLVFQDSAVQWLAPTSIATPAEPWTAASPPGFGKVVEAAMALHPDARLADVSFPTADSAVWRVRLRTDGEARRAYGRTAVFVSGNSGQVLANLPASDTAPSRAFLDGLFPFHTGEIAGLPGRIAVVATGAWLLTMTLLGFVLWKRRRRTR
ncbi:PepSY-associated TM helix domain-containing protein [Sphingosinicella sp.]|uniref:PepSY-associated TM helix domain-containing protein n=1 Tax=Sphingosinicella sp. TaxID=1917971 RepID=UPI0035AD8B3E